MSPPAVGSSLVGWSRFRRCVPLPPPGKSWVGTVHAGGGSSATRSAWSWPSSRPELQDGSGISEPWSVGGVSSISGAPSAVSPFARVRIARMVPCAISAAVAMSRWASPSRAARAIAGARAAVASVHGGDRTRACAAARRWRRSGGVCARSARGRRGARGFVLKSGGRAAGAACQGEPAAGALGGAARIQAGAAASTFAGVGAGAIHARGRPARQPGRLAARVPRAWATRRRDRSRSPRSRRAPTSP